jgi:hypothetical protein
MPTRKTTRTYRLFTPTHQLEKYIGCVRIKDKAELDLYNVFNLGGEYRLQKCGDTTTYFVKDHSDDDICSCTCPHYTKRKTRPIKPCKHIALIRSITK